MNMFFTCTLSTVSEDHCLEEFHLFSCLLLRNRYCINKHPEILRVRHRFIQSLFKGGAYRTSKKSAQLNFMMTVIMIPLLYLINADNSCTIR